MKSFGILGIVALLCAPLCAPAQYGGDPYRSYTDQMVIDHINLRRAAERRRAASKTRAKQRRGQGTGNREQDKAGVRRQALGVLSVKGLPYDAARKKIIAAGWQPRRQPASYANSPNVQGGNGLIFWKKGYTEITGSSGTGKAFCRFEFRNAAGSLLSVVTAGEEDPDGKYHAVVDNVSVRTKKGK